MASSTRTDRPEQAESKAAKMGALGKYAYAWFTIAFFVISLILHWYFGWEAHLDEARQHDQAPNFDEYLTVTLRDTFENWQSEFLQLLWQVLGLAYFLYVGSPSSKENDDRMEAKIDALITLHGGKEGEEMIARIDEQFLRHGGHARPHG